MKFLSSLILGSLRTTALVKSNKIHLLTNHQFLIKSNFCSSREIILTSSFQDYLTDEEQKIIKKQLAECDTNEDNWRHDLLMKMAQIHFNREETYGSLDQDKIDLVKSDYQKLKDNKLAVPKYITDEMINDLSKIWTDDKSRFHMLAFLGIKQLKRYKCLCNKQIKSSFDLKTAKQIKRESVEQVYATSYDQLFMKQRKLNYNQHRKMLNSIFEGQNLVLDFSFSNNCLNAEKNSIASQTQRIAFFNLDTDRPFNLWFTSLEKDSLMKEKLERATVLSPKNFVNCSEKHFTELFPKDKLIYLSPDAEETIEDFDRQAVYVLGAVVDRYSDEPLTFQSAKQHNIRSVKLPLEKYVLLSDLATDLSFHSVFQMLNYMQYEYATWENAFRQYLQLDRRVDELELIKKFNPSLKSYSKREVERHTMKVKYQYQNRLFKKIENIN